MDSRIPLPGSLRRQRSSRSARSCRSKTWTVFRIRSSRWRVPAPVIVLENVPGLLTANRGSDFAAVLQSLASCGYALGWRVLDSRYFRVPQTRRRVYVVGCFGNPSRAAEILFEREGGGGDAEAASRENVSHARAEISCVRTGRTAKRFSYCLTPSTRSVSNRNACNPLVIEETGVRNLTPVEWEMVQGFPAGWTLVDGAADASRYRAIGNAVTVPVAQWLGERIQPG